MFQQAHRKQWSGESDWNNQFTSKGKIRVIAMVICLRITMDRAETSRWRVIDGSDGLKEVFPGCSLLQTQTQRAGGTPQWEDTISTYGYPFHKVHVDKREITANGKYGMRWHSGLWQTVTLVFLFTCWCGH